MELPAFRSVGVLPLFFYGVEYLSGEVFRENGIADIFSQLKLRAGWGQVGNQGSAGYHDYVALMNNGYTSVIGGTAVDGAIQETVANRELSWETAEQYNIGLDFGL